MIYRSTSEDGTYEKVYAVNTEKYTDTHLTTGNTYYYKVRAYKTADVKTIYSAYPNLVDVKAK